MRIKVKLFGPLKDRLPPEKRQLPIEVEIAEGGTVQDVAEQLGISDIGFIVLINDQEGHRNKRLMEGDVVSFFPPLAGGSAE